MKLTDKELKERASIGMNFIKVEHNWRDIAKASEEYYKYIIKNIIK